jgi:hypothetical protein
MAPYNNILMARYCHLPVTFNSCFFPFTPKDTMWLYFTFNSCFFPSHQKTLCGSILERFLSNTTGAYHTLRYNVQLTQLPEHVYPVRRFRESQGRLSPSYLVIDLSRQVTNTYRFTFRTRRSSRPNQLI